MKKTLFNITFIILLLSCIMCKSVSNMDEIWSYTFARNIATGLLPYRDFAIVSTPLSCFINSILLLINNSMFMFRIITLLYFIAFSYLISKIFNYLNINKNIKYLVIIFLPLVLIRYCYLDYNILSIILVMLIIYLELKSYNNYNKKLDIYIPLLISLLILTKQSIGLIIAFTSILYLLLNKYIYKQKIGYKDVLKRILLILMPLLMFILYLLITNSYNSFISIAVLGLKTFTNNKIVIKALLLLVVITILFILCLIKNKKYNRIFILYALPCLSLSYPIIDVVHVLISIIPITIYIIYVIGSKINIKYDARLIFIILMLMIIMYNGYDYIKSYKSKIDVYKYLPIEKEIEDKILEVNKYIDNNTYILDYQAGLYMISIDRYNKYFDLFMNGNFGIDGISYMKRFVMNNDLVILMNNNHKNYQEPTEVKEYVKDLYYETDEVGMFTIYKKNI